MNDPKKNESTEAKDETVKDGGEAAEASIEEKDLEGVAGGGIVWAPSSSSQTSSTYGGNI